MKALNTGWGRPRMGEKIEIRCIWVRVAQSIPAETHLMLLFRWICWKGQDLFSPAETFPVFLYLSPSLSLSLSYISLPLSPDAHNNLSLPPSFPFFVVSHIPNVFTWIFLCVCVSLSPLSRYLLLFLSPSFSPTLSAINLNISAEAIVFILLGQSISSPSDRGYNSYSMWCRSHCSHRHFHFLPAYQINTDSLPEPGSRLRGVGSELCSGVGGTLVGR